MRFATDDIIGGNSCGDLVLVYMMIYDHGVYVMITIDDIDK